MKKLVSIFLLSGLFFLSASLFGQETVVLTEDFSKFTEGQPNGQASGANIENSLNDYMHTEGWSGSRVYQAGGAAKIGTSTALGFLQTPLINLSGDNGLFVIRFKAMAWSGDSTAMKVIVNGTTHIVRGLSNSSNYTMRDFELYLTNGTANSAIRFEGLQAAKGRFFIDDLTIATVSGPIVAFTPLSLYFGNVEVGFSSNESVHIKGYNITGNDADITIAGEGFSSTVTSISVADLNTGVDVPVTYSPTAVGDHTGTITVSGANITTPFTCNLIGKGVTVTTINTLADLRTKLDFSNTLVNHRDTVIYKFTGEVIVTSVDNNYYHYSTVQDSTAAMILYGATQDFVSGIEEGQILTDIYGTLTNYYGLLEFVPTLREPRLVSPFSPEDAITPFVVTFDNMLDMNFMKDHQGKVIRINNASFLSTGSFEANKKYRITDGNSTDSLVFTFYRDAACVGTTIPQGERDNITGVCYISYDKYYLVPRTRGDVVSINSVDFNNKVSVYPNPVTNQFSIEGIMPHTVEFYNALGVLVSQINNPGRQISTANLSSGVYIVKFITDEGVAMKKIVKQ